jgi:hypothetical protein
MKLQKFSALMGLWLLAITASADIDLTLTPPALDLGSAGVGSTVSGNADIGISFNGQGNLAGNANNGTVTSVAITNPVGASFTASQNCVGVDFSAASPQAICTVQVDCTPDSVGAISADLEVQFDLLNNSGIQTQTTALSCNGVLAQPGSGAESIPTMSLYSLGILSLLLAGFSWMRLRRQNR